MNAQITNIRNDIRDITTGSAAIVNTIKEC